MNIIRTVFDRDMKRALSIREVLARREKTLELSEPWAEAFGSPSATGVWFVWGQSGSGKTSFVMQLCKELCRLYRGVYNSYEEGVSLTMKQNLERNYMGETNSRLVILDGEPMDELGARMDRHKSPHFYVIDSFQYSGLSAKSYFDFVNAHKNKLIIFISQAEGKKPSGRTAGGVLYDASLKIWVEGFRAWSKGRYFGPKGYYDVWPARAHEYWGNQESLEL